MDMHTRPLTRDEILGFDALKHLKPPFSSDDIREALRVLDFSRLEAETLIGKLYLTGKLAQTTFGAFVVVDTESD